MDVFNTYNVFDRYDTREYKNLFLLNPMTSIIVAYRDILYYKSIPQMTHLLNAII
jgi:ABC-2 type transport system permease protein